jgi:cyclopropane fatty-acyl-phospholipid synthase-like methyltransferase
MLPFSEACERNKDPILQVLRIVLANRAQVLEIGSGTGQHAVYFASQLPHLVWHPTERLEYLPQLAMRTQAEGARNLRPPTVLDVRQRVWPVRIVDAIYTANTLHIMSWPEVTDMFRGIAATLAPSGSLCIYGPFHYGGRPTSPSNEAFDRMLRERDAASGVRDVEATIQLATEAGLQLAADHDLPAFNRLLVFMNERLKTPRS